MRSHTRTLWQLLRARRIPTFIFVNKCDISERRRRELLDEIRTVLSPSCVDFMMDEAPEFYESVAGCDERLMGEYFDTDAIRQPHIADSIRACRIFPCYFGSALKLTGVSDLLSGLDKYTVMNEYGDSLFGARVYKITRDPSGRRITFAKITGGSLKPKDTVDVKLSDGSTVSEKIEEIRVYSGDRKSVV